MILNLYVTLFVNTGESGAILWIYGCSVLFTSHLNIDHGEHDKYLITPERNSGDLLVSSLPTNLNVRQLGISSYPSRELYVVDFNNYRISERIRTESIKAGNPMTDIQVLAKTKEMVDSLRLRMPFTITIERDSEDKELLTISSIRDRNGNEISTNNVDINIQSLGAENRYWLDTGIFEIQ